MEKPEAIPAITQQATFAVKGMSCAACQSFVERRLHEQPGVAEARVNLLMHEAVVTYNPEATSLDRLLDAVRDSGYEAEAPRTEGDQKTQEDGQHEDELHYRKLLRLAAASLASGAAAMLLSIPLMAGSPGHVAAGSAPGQQRRMLQILSAGSLRLLLLALTAVVLATAGRQFFEKAWAGLRHRRADMSTLVALGTGVAFLYSAAVTLAPRWFVVRGISLDVYYDAALLIVGFVLLGQVLEARAKGQTVSALQELLALAPPTAERLGPNGSTEVVALARLQPGDLLLLRPGARVPVDAEVVEGMSFIDEAMLTGEPMPVEKGIGANVTGGTVNTTGVLRLRVLRRAGQGTLADIMKLLREAQGGRAPMQRFADRVSGVFVPVVVLLALITFAAWMFFDPARGALPHAFAASVAVLVIACPCAMGLAVPAALMVATGRGAQMGLLFRTGAALEELRGIDTVLLDKTGTVTEGRPEIRFFTVADGYEKEAVLTALAALEKQSEHPLAAAIQRFAGSEAFSALASDAGEDGHKGSGSRVRNFQAHPGFGAEAQVGGSRVMAGNAALLLREEITVPNALAEQAALLAEHGATPLWVAIDGEVAAVLGASDPPRPTSRQAVTLLHARGLRVVLVSGDVAEAARAVAADIGIAPGDVMAGVLPAGKFDVVRRLQAQGRRVLMVGDGINDAPALAAAEVGMAMGSGTEIAVHASDVTLLRADLRGVADALRLAHVAGRIMRQNLGWALGYNLLAVPLAAGVLYPHFHLMLSPIVASAAMAMSSFSVVMNSLRLRRVEPIAG